MADENDQNVSNKEVEENDAPDNATDGTQETEPDNGSNDATSDASTQAADTEARFARLESTLERVLGEISAIREAQGIMVENGAVITDADTDMDFTDADAFVPPAEMDLLI